MFIKYSNLIIKMVYTVHTTKTFEKEVEKLEFDKQKRIAKLYFKLKDNPYAGDQLRYKFFREKRLDEKRIYYLVYDDIKIVLMVGISDKKDQLKTISFIVRYFDEFRKYAEKLRELSGSSHSTGF